MSSLYDSFPQESVKEIPRDSQIPICVLTFYDSLSEKKFRQLPQNLSLIFDVFLTGTDSEERLPKKYFSICKRKDSKITLQPSNTTNAYTPSLIYLYSPIRKSSSIINSGYQIESLQGFSISYMSRGKEKILLKTDPSSGTYKFPKNDDFFKSRDTTTLVCLSLKYYPGAPEDERWAGSPSLLNTITGKKLEGSYNGPFLTTTKLIHGQVLAVRQLKKLYGDSVDIRIHPPTPTIPIRKSEESSPAPSPVLSSEKLKKTTEEDGAEPDTDDDKNEFILPGVLPDKIVLEGVTLLKKSS